MTVRRSARKARARRKPSLEDEVVLRGFADFDPC
jgi:hypothetical protein